MVQMSDLMFMVCFSTGLSRGGSFDEKDGSKVTPNADQHDNALIDPHPFGVFVQFSKLHRIVEVAELVVDAILVGRDVDRGRP